MKRIRRRRKQLSVSLFPFLAVLICTFGVLIVLLVLTIKAADQDAVAENDADAEEAQALVDDLNAKLDHHTVVAENLLQVRPRLKQRLQDERDKRAHLENEIAKIESEALVVAQQLKALMNPSEEKDRDWREIQQQLEQSNRDLREAKRRLAEKKIEKRSTPEQLYSIVPHQGNGGTKRRPIYIECTESQLVLQPYGIKIDVRDFVHPIGPQNPLDAALMAVRQHFVQFNLAASGESPYPLLVVRPSGAEAYIVARHAMRGWDDEFGYELIPQETALDFGQANPELESDIRNAVASAIAEQQARKLNQLQARNHPAGSGGDQRNQSGGLRASPTHGGFVAQTNGDQQINTTRNQVAHADGSSQQSSSQRSLDEMEQATDQIVSGDNSSGGGSVAGSLAQKRGQNWALPSQTDGAIGYLRPVRIICGTDELAIQSTRNPKRQVVFKFGAEPSVTVDALVQYLWKLIDRWGVAGVGGYWKPQLRFTVMPDANGRYQQVKKLLDGSGLQIEEQP